MSKATGKPLRFAALIRVSTEKQERRGESLRTQGKQLTQAVASMGGEIVASYAGQEHGTPGWERRQLEKLLADAAKKHKPFDAVIVTDPSRWSRDNVANETGLDHLRDHGIRFFVLGMEFDLYDPMHRHILSTQAGMNKLHAMLQKQKSLLNRIERAKRGIPTGGKLPFGRLWDAEKEEWSVDPDKQAIVEDAAARYLAGESLPKLAREYGMNHSSLCKLLRERCGDKWTIEFRADDLNIRETVTLTIPRLLPEKTIRALRQRLEANRTYLNGKPKHDYLLSGHVRCASCGYVMFGQMSRHGHLYYRHHHHGRVRACAMAKPRKWVRADALEGAVIGDIFRMLGNPAALERAVKAAVPDGDKALKQRDRLTAEIAKIEKARGRVLSLIEKDALTDAQAEDKLRDLKDREAGLRSELDALALQLADVPDAEAIRVFVERIGDRPGDVVLYDEEGNLRAGGNDLATLLEMRADDFRDLLRRVFGSPRSDGKPPGVYIRPAEGRYEIRGNLVGTLRGVIPRASY